MGIRIPVIYRYNHIMIKPFNVDPEDFRKAVSVSSTIKEALQYIGMPHTQGSYYRRFHETCKVLNVPTKHFKRDYSYLHNKAIPLKDILIKESKYTNTGHIKNRLLKEGLLEYRCYNHICTVTNDWLGATISLQLDHINGINNDNRLENLRLLCPNCHSQTSTFAGRRNKSPIKVCNKCRKSEIYKTSKICKGCSWKLYLLKYKKMNLTRDELKYKLKDPSMSIRQIAKSLNMSDTALRKWCKKWNLKPNKPNRGSNINGEGERLCSAFSDLEGPYSSN